MQLAELENSDFWGSWDDLPLALELGLARFGGFPLLTDHAPDLVFWISFGNSDRVRRVLYEMSIPLVHLFASFWLFTLLALI